MFLPQTAEGAKTLATPTCTHDPEVESFIKVISIIKCFLFYGIIFDVRIPM